MILFDLLCSKGHAFEAWFRDGDSFDRLVAVGEIHCSICGDADIKKALMAPNISPSKTASHHPERDAKEDDSAEPSNEGKTESEATSNAPSVTVQDNAVALGGKAGMPVPEKIAEAMHVLRQVQSHIEKNFDHVGKGFAEEARKMHYGEAEKRSIYGEATREEAEDLVEEGIEVNQMPWLPPRDS